MPEIKKYFVSSDMKTTLTCPECKKTKRADVSKFMLTNSQVNLKCNCTCGHQFSAVLERRRSVRKGVSFPGWLIQSGQKVKVRVKNISKHGLKLHLLAHAHSPLLTESKIGIQFNTDDPMQSIVSRDVRIKKMISPTEIGCEFLSFDHSGNLGKYFLFYF